MLKEAVVTVRLVVAVILSVILFIIHYPINKSKHYLFGLLYYGQVLYNEYYAMSMIGVKIYG